MPTLEDKITGIKSQLVAQGMCLKSTYIGSDNKYAVYPNEEGVPFYARDAELFVGSLDEIQIWLLGIQWAVNYYRILGIDDGSKRVKIEHSERERQLLHALQSGRLPVLRK